MFKSGDPLINGVSNNINAYVEIYHLLTDNNVRFKAFINNFSDDHVSRWNSENLYGRMDAIHTFQGTTRMISIQFDVPSYDVDEALENLKKVSLLKQFLYPAYSQTRNALAISSSPLVRFKFMNLAVDSKTFDNGLLSVLKNVNFSPEMKEGVHVSSITPELKKVLLVQNAKNINSYIIPKLFSLSLNFEIIHEHQLGWTKNETIVEVLEPGRTAGQGAQAGTSGKTILYNFGGRTNEEGTALAATADVNYYPYGIGTTLSETPPISNAGTTATDLSLLSSQEQTVLTREGFPSVDNATGRILNSG